MKRTLLILSFVVVNSAVVLAQAGHAGQEKSLRGLKGVRLVVMFARAEGVDEAQRPAILKLVEADAAARLRKAGIPLLRYVNQEAEETEKLRREGIPVVRNPNEGEDDDPPILIVYITCDKLNGFVYPLVTNVKLLQKVRLSRDPSIETDLATWEQRGIGGPTLNVEMIRRQVASEIDQFIRDYFAENPR